LNQKRKGKNGVRVEVVDNIPNIQGGRGRRERR
jgi:hypothetical protein